MKKSHWLLGCALIATSAGFTPSIASAQTPANDPVRQELTSLGLPTLPDIYAPQQSLPRFNSNEPPLVPDQAELSRLKFSAPQWLKQFLAMPSEYELLRSLGRAREETIRKAAEAINLVVVRKFLPPDFEPRMIPLSSWAVLYEDWRNNAGADVFLTKFQVQRYVVVLCESANNILVFVRDTRGERARDVPAMLKHVLDASDLILQEHVKPLNQDSLRIIRNSTSPNFLYGFYSPKIESITGAPAATPATTGSIEQSQNAGATSVRFFTNGDFVGFMILKPVFGGELRNPFEPRFETLNLVKPDALNPTPTGEKAGAADLGRQQLAEYIGTLPKSSGTDTAPGTTLTYRDLEKAFLTLSPEQKLEIIQRKTVDEYFSEGLRAYDRKDYRAALSYWTRILTLDPANSRVALLIQNTIAKYKDSEYANREDKAREDKWIVEATEAMNRQQLMLSVAREQRKQDSVKERAILNYRTRAIGFLSEGNTAESLREWDKLLSIDPGNPTALLYKDMLERRADRERKYPSPQNP